MKTGLLLIALAVLLCACRVVIAPPIAINIDAKDNNTTTETTTAQDKTVPLNADISGIPSL